MIDAGIDDGDYVVIRKDNNISKKSIVAVEVDGHATLKRKYIFDFESDAPWK